MHIRSLIIVFLLLGTFNFGTEILQVHCHEIITGDLDAVSKYFHDLQRKEYSSLATKLLETLKGSLRNESQMSNIEVNKKLTDSLYDKEKVTNFHNFNSKTETKIALLESTRHILDSTQENLMIIEKKKYDEKQKIGRFGSSTTTNMPARFGFSTTTKKPGRFGSSTTTNKAARFGSSTTANKPAHVSSPIYIPIPLNLKTSVRVDDHSSLTKESLVNKRVDFSDEIIPQIENKSKGDIYFSESKNKQVTDLNQLVNLLMKMSKLEKFPNPSSDKLFRSDNFPKNTKFMKSKKNYPLVIQNSVFLFYLGGMKSLKEGNAASTGYSDHLPSIEKRESNTKITIDRKSPIHDNLQLDNANKTNRFYILHSIQENLMSNGKKKYDEKQMIGRFGSPTTTNKPVRFGSFTTTNKAARIGSSANKIKPLRFGPCANKITTARFGSSTTANKSTHVSSPIPITLNLKTSVTVDDHSSLTKELLVNKKVDFSDEIIPQIESKSKGDIHFSDIKDKEVTDLNRLVNLLMKMSKLESFPNPSSDKFFRSDNFPKNTKFMKSQRSRPLVIQNSAFLFYLGNMKSLKEGNVASTGYSDYFPSIKKRESNSKMIIDRKSPVRDNLLLDKNDANQTNRFYDVKNLQKLIMSDQSYHNLLLYGQRGYPIQNRVPGTHSFYNAIASNVTQLKRFNVPNTYQYLSYGTTPKLKETLTPKKQICNQHTEGENISTEKLSETTEQTHFEGKKTKKVVLLRKASDYHEYDEDSDELFNVPY